MRPKVFSVAIELTAFCNQKCDYCYNAWREDGGKSLHRDTPDAVLARVRKLLGAVQLDHVTLTGGEPLASPALFPVLDLLREHAVPAQMISNGGLVTDEIARRLAGYALRFVQVTLDGPNAALHEAHVGPGHFGKTVGGIRTLRAAGVPVVGCIVVTRKNAQYVAEILALFRSLDVHHVALSRFSPAGYAASHVAQLLPSRSDLLAAFGQANPFGVEHGMQLTCTMPVPPCAVEVEKFPAIGFGQCPIGTPMQELALGPDGKLRNCTLHRTAIGGVPDVLADTVDIAALLSAPEITEYRKTTPDFCKGCVHESTCAGGCGAAAEWVLGDARRFPDPVVWQHVDDGFAKHLVGKRNGKTHLETIL